VVNYLYYNKYAFAYAMNAYLPDKRLSDLGKVSDGIYQVNSSSKFAKIDELLHLAQNTTENGKVSLYIKRLKLIQKVRFQCMCFIQQFLSC